MSREEMIERLVNDAGGWPMTIAIAAGEDDPLVIGAQELRQEQWARSVDATIELMGLTGEAAERHRAVAKEAELNYLRRLVEETWELPEAELRARALEIICELAGGNDGDKKFPEDPNTLSRGHILLAIGNHIDWLLWPPETRHLSTAAE